MKNSTKIKILRFVKRILNIRYLPYLIDERRIQPVTLRYAINFPNYPESLAIPMHVIETDIANQLATKMIQDGYISIDRTLTSYPEAVAYRASVQIIKPSDRYDKE